MTLEAASDRADSECRAMAGSLAMPLGHGGRQSTAEQEELHLLAASPQSLKIILLGDSAVGKSKLVERFLLDKFKPHQLSTFALTLYKHSHELPGGKAVPVSIWDTAGQERFNVLHASYYYRAHACIMVFDVTRKVTYHHLDRWYEELQSQCPGIPTIVVANKIDVDYAVTKKSFAFVAKHNLPFFFVSAADGANVVRVFNTAILKGLQWRGADKEDFYYDVLHLLSSQGNAPEQMQQQQHTGGQELPTTAAVHLG